MLIVVNAFDPNHTIMLDVTIRGQSLIMIGKNSRPIPACHKLVTRDGINKREIALGKFVMIVKNAIPTVWKPTPINPLSNPARNIELKIAYGCKVENSITSFVKMTLW